MSRNAVAALAQMPDSNVKAHGKQDGVERAGSETGAPTHERRARQNRLFGVVLLTLEGHGVSCRHADAVYVRFHGASRLYRHDYADTELEAWADKLRASRVKEI